MLGKYSQEMSTLHLVKTYCLSTCLYGVETWSLNDASIHKAWNDSFRHILCSCWRESVKLLQYFCHFVPMSYLTDQRQLLFWQKMLTSDNVLLYVMCRLIVNQFIANGSHYGITSYQILSNMLRLKVWDSFASTVTD